MTNTHWYFATNIKLLHHSANRWLVWDMLSVVHRKGRTFLTRLTVGGILKGTLSAYTCLQITANFLTKLYSSMLKGSCTFPAAQCQIVGTTSQWMSKRVWGELAAAKLGCIWHLGMADALTHIKDLDDRLLDDALWMMREFSLCSKLCGCSSLKRGWCYDTSQTRICLV